MIATAAEEGVRAMRWSKAEYYRLAELGFLQGKVELIDGELIVHAPQNATHADRVDRVGDVLRAAFGAGYRVRCQLPLDLGQLVEPEPDYAVVVAQSYAGGHPTEAALVVEISDSTLAFDRGRKASLYAAGGVADYWIVNLVANRVEVYRDPMPDAAQESGFGYATHVVLHAGDVVHPLALPQVGIAVGDLLP